jgi:hypothetical protein
VAILFGHVHFDDYSRAQKIILPKVWWNENLVVGLSC